MTRKMPTIRQKKALDYMLSGKYKTKKDAMIAAGYSPGSAIATKPLYAYKGAEAYLRTFEQRAYKKFKQSLDTKLQDVYLDGLEAKASTKQGMIPDHRTRKEFADKIAEMKGLIESKTRKPTNYNFFMFDKETTEEFNKKYIEILREQES